MANLLQTIQQNRNQLASQQVPAGDETARVQQLLSAKSGRAVSSAPISNLGEQATNDQTNAALRSNAGQLQLQQAAENQQAAGQEQQFQTAKAGIDQARKFQTVQSRIRTEQLLNDLGRDRGSLSVEKDRSRLEQAAFLLSMQDKTYTDQLQDIGKRKRLDNEANFRQEMEEVALGDQMDLLKQKLGGRDVLTASDREYRKALSGLSIEDARKMAELEMAAAARDAATQASLYQYGAEQQARAANTQGQAQAASQLVTTGLAGAEKLSRPAAATEPGPPKQGGGR